MSSNDAMAEVLEKWMMINSWTTDKLESFIEETAGIEKYEIQRHFAVQALGRRKAA